MEKRNNTKGQIAGGLGILAAASLLCLKGMKAVDARLKAKKEKLKK